MRVLYNTYNINSIVDNLTKQNLMYSLVVSYKVKLHMHAYYVVISAHVGAVIMVIIHGI